MKILISEWCGCSELCLKMEAFFENEWASKHWRIAMQTLQIFVEGIEDITMCRKPHRPNIMAMEVSTRSSVCMEYNPSIKPNNRVQNDILFRCLFLAQFLVSIIWRVMTLIFGHVWRQLSTIPWNLTIQQLPLSHWQCRILIAYGDKLAI